MKKLQWFILELFNNIDFVLKEDDVYFVLIKGNKNGKYVINGGDESQLSGKREKGRGTMSDVVLLLKRY